MMSEEARDEIAIALVGRARPVFAFIGNEDITGSKVVPVVVASVKLSGEHRNVHALRGEISFGTRSACHVVRVPGRSESISMVG